MDGEIQPGLPLASGGAGLGGTIKSEPEDFRVEEAPGEPLSGEGEHAVVRLEKRGMTTPAAAEWLARRFGVSPRQVGYAGMKDKWAVTIQDFSIQDMNRPPPDLESDLPEGFRVLSLGRDGRKIKVGHRRGNRFAIRVRGARRDDESVKRVAGFLTRFGAPNFFGPQRFGRAGDNFETGLQVLARGKTLHRKDKRGRKERGILISAVRSELFNRVLAARLSGGLFQELLAGDVAQLDRRSGCFAVETLETEQARFGAGEIHATGPLYGRKLMVPAGQPLEMEEKIAQEAGEAVSLLEAFGVDGARRALRVIPEDLTWAYEGDDLVLTFGLPKGAYATSIVREFMNGEN